MVDDLSVEAYMPRVADSLLVEKLSYAGAVEIRGPKWCGKTETALRHAESAVMMQDPDERANNLMVAESKPSLLLRGEKPLLIDEWQEAPQLWDAVRFAVDRERMPGQYILTGSATPYAKPRHSGTGRFSFLDMYPMSSAEAGDSTAEVSLGALFERPGEIEGVSRSDVEAVSHLICRGGWPGAVTARNGEASLEMAHDYVMAIAEEDISRVDGVSRSAQYARIVMQEYARCTSTQAAHLAMRKNLKARNTELSRDTVDAYIAALRRLYVIRDLPAWEPSLHAKARVAKTPTRHFVDPSLAAAALGASPRSLLRDLSLCGMLFESLCVRDLRVYAQAHKGEVFHYCDESGLEADAVVALRDGRYALFEVKMGARFVDEGARNLIKLSEKIDRSVMGEPAFCAVLTPGGYALKRPDGVYVVPITCLAP